MVAELVLGRELTLAPQALVRKCWSPVKVLYVAPSSQSAMEAYVERMESYLNSAVSVKTVSAQRR